MDELDGYWSVRRTAGVLPPLAGVRKRIAGDAGWTEVGPVRLPFRVEGRRLRYTGLLRGFVDELEPDGDGFAGHATLAGREYGRFALRRVPTLRGGSHEHPSGGTSDRRLDRPDGPGRREDP